MRFETRAIHVGQDPDRAMWAVVVPSYQTSIFVLEEVGGHRGYEYSQTSDPTRTALEAALASLEEAAHCLALASGMAAEEMLGDDVYGGTAGSSSGCSAVSTPSARSTGGPDAVAAAVVPETKMADESLPGHCLPGGPAGIAPRRRGPPGTRQHVRHALPAAPAPPRADVVVHSTTKTKYLAGHSDVPGRAVCTSDRALAERPAFLGKATGGVPGPFDCWLVLRGLKTHALRMERHCANAGAVARFLARYPAVRAVRYPGLPYRPGHELAARQMDGFGGIVPLEVASRDEAGAWSTARACSPRRIAWRG